jgi:hypothetical protein
MIATLFAAVALLFPLAQPEPCRTIRISEDGATHSRTYEKYVCWGLGSSPRTPLGRARAE